MESTTGKVTGLAHLGYGDENTFELLGYYATVFGVENAMSQEIHHPYIGRINGVTGCPYVIGFIRGANDETRLEFVGCINAVKGHAIFPFGESGHTHMNYTTGDIRACYDRMKEHHVELLGEIKTIDYGQFKGRKGFFLRDLNGIYIQVIEDRTSKIQNGTFDKLVGVSYTISDFEECLDHFAEGLGINVEPIDLAESEYLTLHCGKKVPSEGVYAKIDENTSFTVEILKAVTVNPESKDIWVNSLGSMHICVMVDDIQKIYDRMVDQGMKFVGPPSPVELGINKGAKAIFTKVSNEILVELFQGKPTAV